MDARNAHTLVCRTCKILASCLVVATSTYVVVRPVPPLRPVAGLLLMLHMFEPGNTGGNDKHTDKNRGGGRGGVNDMVTLVTTRDKTKPLLRQPRLLGAVQIRQRSSSEL